MAARFSVSRQIAMEMGGKGGFSGSIPSLQSHPLKLFDSKIIRNHGVTCRNRISEEASCRRSSGVDSRAEEMGSV